MEIKENGTTATLTLPEMVDVTTVSLFTCAVDNLCEKKIPCIEVDMSKVLYIDSTGISLLIRLFKHQNQNGLKFSITKISEKAQSIISLCSLSETLTPDSSVN